MARYAPAATAPTAAAERSTWALTAPNEPRIALQLQQTKAPQPRAHVLYVHGATFGADLSICFPFDGRSWADSLTDAGYAVWGFDFVGYGASDRHPPKLGRPAGAIDDATRELRRVVAAVRQRNGNQPVVVVAHSRGAAVAARFASEQGPEIAALVLFGPIVARPAPTPAPASGPAATKPAMAPPAPPSHYPLSVWAQYRRFVDDVPKGQPQLLSEAHMQAWSTVYLASDPSSATRVPPSVLTSYGPLADLAAFWSGQALYDATNIVAPTLIVRGEWDTVCTDADADRLMQQLGAAVKDDVKLLRATHLMHLEQQRTALYAAVECFLNEVLP
jgi:alpha-beta hydrolase superfamily lysophospholipase